MNLKSERLKMKILITFTKEDLIRLLAEHCRKQFKVDPKNVDIELLPSVHEYIGKVEGEYQPD